MSDLGRYRKVFARLWRHPGFLQLTDTEKVVALYLLTGTQTNRLGLYVLSIATAAEDLGTVPQTFKKRLIVVCQTFGWLFDARARVMYIPSWFHWNPPENVNVMKGNLKDLNEIPPCGLVEAFARNTGTIPETLRETFLEGLRQRLPRGQRSQVHYQNPNLNQKPKRAHLTEGVDKGEVVSFGEDKKDRQEDPNQTRVRTIATEVSRDNPHANTDYLLDATINQCRSEGLNVNRDMAVAALAAVSVEPPLVARHGAGGSS